MRRSTRFARRAGFDRNPMRRASDRIEAWVRLGVLVAFLVVGTVCVWFAVSATQLRQARAAHAVRYPVTAVLRAPATVATVDGMALPKVYVEARWTGPDAVAHQGLVPAVPGAPAGSTVRVWTTPTGQLTDGPAGRTQRDAALALVALLAVAVPAGLLAVVATATRRALDRRRLVDWELDWLRVEPGWSGRRQV